MAAVALLGGSMIMAQTELDVLKYVQTDINGTARYMGMAGAFGALGGDASAIKDNPAGLGIYRSSELVGSMNYTMQSSSANWNGTNITLDNPYKTGFDNFSFVLASQTWRNESETGGLLSSNWSFSYNRLKNFNKSVNIKSGATGSSLADYMAYFTGNISRTDLTYTSSYEPFNNQNIPWISVLASYEDALLKEHINTSTGKTDYWYSLLAGNETVTPSYYLTEKGYIDEYSVGWAGNFNNTFYIGATANIQSIDYMATSKYSENFDNGGDMDLNNTVISKGTGINLNIGTIFRPTDFVRLGLSLHTPTVLAMHDNYYATLNSNTDINRSIGTPTDGYNDFQIQGPIQFNLSGALIVGKKGIISAEYVYTNYTGTRLMDKDGDPKKYNEENLGMKDMLNDVQTIKIGGEYKLNDNFSLRAGYANSGNANKSDAQKYMVNNTIRTDTEYFLHNSTNYITAGFGYREASWFIDCAYMYKILDESFMPYNSNQLSASLAVTPASVKTTTNNVIITLGLRF